MVGPNSRACGAGATRGAAEVRLHRSRTQRTVHLSFFGFFVLLFG